MPRIARERSEIKVYHVILRGVNKQQIFECTEDYEYFIRILRAVTGGSIGTGTVTRFLGQRDRYLDPPTLEKWDRVKVPVPIDPKTGSRYLSLLTPEDQRHCYIYAWCLMGNHVHLLMKEADEPIGDVVKRISSSYVYYYNHKYDRIGHLFQERFKSQPVEDWDYFLTLVRYIHQNPLKAHLVTDLKDYRWSSWQEYIGCSEHPFTSIQPVLRRISLEKLDDLIATPMTETEEEKLLDAEFYPQKKYTDDKVWQLIEKYSGATNAESFQALPRPLQKHYLYCVYEEGVGPRILSRLTGVNYSVVQRATSSAKERDLLEQFRHRQSATMLREEDYEDELWYTYCDEDDFKQDPEY